MDLLSPVHLVAFAREDAMTEPAIDAFGAAGRRTRPGETGTSARRRRVDQDRRAELVPALEDLLLREGFTTLTVDDMARRLRCSKATLYSVASSKEQLVIALTKRFFQQ